MAYMSNKTSFAPIEDADLQLRAPSIFAGNAMAGVSSRYSFMPTIDVVRGLRKEGWMPVMASEQRVNVDTRRGFQKHMIRFRRAADSERIQSALQSRDMRKPNFPEIVLVNSHDRSSAYQIHAGMFRLVCANGLIVADSTFDKVSIKHCNVNADKVIEGTFRVVDSIPALESQVEGFRQHQLSAPERGAFAQAALVLKYEDAEKAPLRAEKLLEPRRTADTGTDLWTTLNAVQENLMRGGLKDFSRRREDGNRFKRTGAVKGIDENVRLNKALWTLAEALKAAR